jgi:hypothetical protein
MSAEVLARWEAFQQKTQQRFQEIMQEAEAGFRDLIASDPTDVITFGNAERGIHARVLALVQKINDTFLQQVNLNVDGPERDLASARMKQQTSAMTTGWQRLLLGKKADLYRAMYPLAMAAMQSPVPCTNCGSPLTKQDPLQVEALTCPACRTVVQAAYPPVVASYFGGAGQVFPEIATFDKRAAIEAQRERAYQARRTSNGWADEPIESLRQWEQMELDSWRTFFTTKAQFVRMTPQQIEEWVASRMRPFYEDLERSNDVWRRAKGLPTGR